MVSCPGHEARRRWLAATLALLEEEILAGGATAHVVRLTDAVFVHLVADSAARAYAPARGLFVAAKDEQIGRALALVHRRSVEGLERARARGEGRLVADAMGMSVGEWRRARQSAS